MEETPKNLIIELLISVVKEIVVEIIKKYMNENHENISKENLEYLYNLAETEVINRFTDSEIEVCMIHNFE